MARYADIITLKKATCEIGDNGRPIVEEEETETFFNRYKLGLSQMLMGGADGQRETAAGQIRSCDYDGQNIAILDGKEYTIKSVNDQGEFSTLTLERRLTNE